MGLADRATMLPQDACAPRDPRQPSQLVRRQPDPRSEASGMHEPAPLCAVRAHATAVKRYHGRVSRLVAQDLEHKILRSINQERGESDLGPGQKTASHGSPQSCTDSDLEISLQLGYAPKP